MASDPIRTYFNRHFEAVKDEVRRRTADAHEQTVEAVARVDASEAERVEQLSGKVDELSQQIDELADLVGELRATNDQLLAIVAQRVERPDGPPT